MGNNGNPKTNNRASAFVVDYDSTAGAKERAKNPPPQRKLDIDFYVDTPHRSALVAAGSQDRPGPLRRVVRSLLRRK